jgi:hypothetical protein
MTMTVNDLREALEKMPGHWPVHVAVLVAADGGGAEEDFLFTLECVPENFPSQGCMAVVRVNYEPR